MLNYLKKEANTAFTENNGLTQSTTDSNCLDLFFRAGAMRNADEKEIADSVIRAYGEDSEKTMKIIFFARDIRGGLGERRFFRIAIRTLADFAPDAIRRNISLIAEYGRFDDICVLLDTACCYEAAEEIQKQLSADIAEYKNDRPISLLAKWLPSVNASSEKTRIIGRKLAKLLKMTEPEYRRTLSELRRYTDIIENRLRTKDYTFDYEKQTSYSMFKYRKAFIRNDNERYTEYLEKVRNGKADMNASVLYPYDIIRKCTNSGLSHDDKLALDVTWKSLPEFGQNNDNAIAVIDGSGSMSWSPGQSVRPIDAALSLGIYFAEHNKGTFANHFITFSEHPKLVEIKGSDIFQKVQYCQTFNEVTNTNLEAVFDLILKTAVRNRVPQSEFPAKMYIISDMEFDSCVEGGNNDTLFRTMQRKYAKFGYKLPNVIFWNVESRHDNFPVTRSETGAALVSGFTPALFDMVMSGDVTPEKMMNDIIYSKRYKKVS